jgi:LysR family transcriptional regulator, cys regulon transcriptional activator
MGIAVLATITFDPAKDKGLVAVDAGHLFQADILSLVFRTHGYLSRPVQSFLALFAPHIPPGLIKRAIDGADIDRARLIQRLPVAPASNATKA